MKIIALRFLSFLAIGFSCVSAEDVAICAVPVGIGNGISRFTPPQVVQIDPNVSVPVAAIYLDEAWESGQTVFVEFVDQNVDQRLADRVIRYVREWEKHVNLRFTFVPTNRQISDYGRRNAHIRVSFLHSGHYSVIGKNSEQARLGPDNHSMNLSINLETPENEVKRTVLHEFGHAIGFQHEHQSPRGGIRWKQPDAIEYYMQFTGWSRERVQQNVFKEAENALATMFDPRSIMLYPIPRGLTTDGFWVDWNSTLSPTDIAAAKNIYQSFEFEKFGAIARVSNGNYPQGVIVTTALPEKPFRKLVILGDPKNKRLYLHDKNVVTAVNGNPTPDLKALEVIESRWNKKDRLVITMYGIDSGNIYDLIYKP